MNYSGIIIGLMSFVIIGVCHPIVIKTEYYFGKKIWPVFLVLGVALCTASLVAENEIISAILALAGFSSFYSIKELYEQEARVKKGWFPANPKRNIDPNTK
jgi:hypothetical protein